MIDIFSSVISCRLSSARSRLRGVVSTACLLCAALFFSTPLSAAEVRGLYETEVLVTSQGSSERNEAIRIALDEVLIRISGDRNTPRLVALQGLYQRSLQLVQQYRYRALPQQSGSNGGAGLTQMLWVSFNQSAIDQALRRAGVSLWGQVRPATLVWVAIDDGHERAMMGAETLAQPKRVMQQQAQRRGLPLFVPLWDLEDQLRLRFTDVWGNFQDAISPASARYATEGILVGRLLQQGAVWEGRWTLYQGGVVEHWRVTSPLQAEVLSAGVDGAADLLGKRFAQVFDESQSDRVKVTIRDITTLEDYARASQFLRSMDVVKALKVARVDGTYVTFALQVRGTIGGLAQTIGFGRTLLEIPAVDLDSDGAGLHAPVWEVSEAGQQLWYRLLP